MKIEKTKLINLIGLFLFITSTAVGDTTGRIVGKVTDAHRVGLPGAKIVVVGTKISVESDMDGSYLIPNVPAGIYTLKAGMIGYSDSTETGVRVINGQTTTQNFKLGIYFSWRMFSEPSYPRKYPEDRPLVDLSKVKGTVFTVTMKMQIKENENLLYCPAFLIAWNEFQGRLIKEPIRLEGDPHEDRALNDLIPSTGVLPESSYVAMADTLSQSLFKRLDGTLQGKFGDHAPPELKEIAKKGPTRFLIFAYFYKDLSFADPFVMMPDLLWFHSGNQDDQVLAFGYDTQVDTTKRQDMESQVQLLYENGGKFIIQIKTKSPREDLILAKVEPKKTLLETIEEVEGIVDKGRLKPPRKEVGYLGIPILDFNIKHDFEELTDRTLLNESWGKWRIADAIQCIRFRLKSAESYPLFVTKTRKANTAQSYLFDRPFLIYFKQTGARYPYFALWVGNTALMSAS